MLSKTIRSLYNKCRVHFFEKIFSVHSISRENSRDLEGLTTVEAVSLECIVTLGSPTVAEFASMMGISAPNAAYKVNNLYRKGFIEKVQSSSDRREFHLRPTQKYLRIRNQEDGYLETLEERMRHRFSEEEMDTFNRMLSIIDKELTPEDDAMNYTKSAVDGVVRNGKKKGRL